MPLLQSDLAVNNRESKIKCFVKDNYNRLILTKCFLDILLDESIVNKVKFYGPEHKCKVRMEAKFRSEEIKTNKRSDSSISCDF